MEWQPITEMLEHEPKEVFIGKWIGNRWSIVSVSFKRAATDAGFTHFLRPTLPDPPSREEVANVG